MTNTELTDECARSGKLDRESSGGRHHGATVSAWRGVKRHPGELLLV